MAAAAALRAESSSEKKKKSSLKKNLPCANTTTTTATDPARGTARPGLPAFVKHHPAAAAATASLQLLWRIAHRTVASEHIQTCDGTSWNTQQRSQLTTGTVAPLLRPRRSTPVPPTIPRSHSSLGSRLQ